jgi:hypothetical protein
MAELSGDRLAGVAGNTHSPDREDKIEITGSFCSERAEGWDIK